MADERPFLEVLAELLPQLNGLIKDNAAGCMTWWICLGKLMDKICDAWGRPETCPHCGRKTHLSST